jgi:glutamate/aspartate transport system substrate-binding protein
MVGSSNCRQPLIAFIAIVVAGWTYAASAQSVLDRIAHRQAVVLGYTVASPPMSYLGPDEQPIGYTTDLCRAIAERLRTHMGKPDLGVRFLRMELDTRAQLVRDGSIDLVCNGTSNTPERRDDFAFSPTVYVTETRLVTKADSPARSLGDLSGKKVVVSSGTTAQDTLAERSEALGIELSVARSNDAAFDQLLLGWAQAFALDDVVLDGLVVTSRTPKKYHLLPDVLAREAIGIAFAPGDESFASVVRDAVIDIMQSGELERLYRKWFEGPIPPFDRAIDRPMSDDLKALIASPSNNPIQ